MKTEVMLSYLSEREKLVARISDAHPLSQGYDKMVATLITEIVRIDEAVIKIANIKEAQ